MSNLSVKAPSPTAVILAAGLGSRLRGERSGPKGLLELGGVTLLARMLAALHGAGVSEIVLVTGHEAEQFAAFLARHAPTVRRVHNPDYARTGSMHSLWLARSAVPGDLLLLESDLLFEPRAITALLESREADAVLLSGTTGQGDEVHALGEGTRLRALTKKKPADEASLGEFVGITRLSAATFAALCRHYDTTVTFPSNYHYDDGLTALAATRRIGTVAAPDLCWAEIDDAAQLDRALRVVLPRLEATADPGPVPRRILLNPGPCTTSWAVKRALLMPDLCPREAEFGDLLDRVRAKLLATVNAQGSHTAVLLGGSGTLAVEAALVSLVGPGDRLLVIENGAYGRRMADIAQAHGLDFRTVALPWGEAPDLAAMEAALAAEPTPTHCCFVHHETTTGMLNPLAAITAACRSRGIVTIVDAMSSLGGVPLDLRADPADCVVSSANKCLQGMPGIAFVLVRPELLAQAGSRPRRSLYLHLPDQWAAQEKERQFLYTPPVQVVRALDAALDEFFAEGAAARHARYAACHAVLLAGMQRLGFACLVPPAWQSGLLTTFLEPADSRWSFGAMHDYLFARGITVYPGKVPGLRSFRLATLGDLTPADVDRFLGALGEYLRNAGFTPSELRSRPDRT
jgi:2-aminoethylphosphonate-pyruvate transaminase